MKSFLNMALIKRKLIYLTHQQRRRRRRPLNYFTILKNYYYFKTKIKQNKTIFFKNHFNFCSSYRDFDLSKDSIEKIITNFGIVYKK